MPKKLKIAMIAPLSETVPPSGYGGIELVIANLAEELTKFGHEVTVFCAGGSKVKAKIFPVTEIPLRKATRITTPAAYQAIELVEVARRAKNFDIIHNHIDYNAFVLKEYLPNPMVTTFHGPINTPEQEIIYRMYDKEIAFVPISDNQKSEVSSVKWEKTVYNGIYLNKYHLARHPKRNYLLFLNRISLEKGAHIAIEVARKFKMKLILAGKVDKVDEDYFNLQIRPYIDGRKVEMVGEVCCGRKNELLSNAYAVLYPDTWAEPFGLVMIEAMASGTPVVGTRNGSIPEIIEDNVTGFLGDTISELVDKLKNISQIDPLDCRRRVEEKFTATRMTDDYLEVYYKLLNL